MYRTNLLQRPCQGGIVVNSTFNVSPQKQFLLTASGRLNQIHLSVYYHVNINVYNLFFLFSFSLLLCLGVTCSQQLSLIQKYILWATANVKILLTKLTSFCGYYFIGFKLKNPISPYSTIFDVLQGSHLKSLVFLLFINNIYFILTMMFIFTIVRMI